MERSPRAASAGAQSRPLTSSLVARNRPAALVLVAFFAADMVFIVVRLATPLPPVEPHPGPVLLELTPSDLVMHAMWLTAAAAMWLVRRTALLYRLWALVFLYVFLDDLSMVHERVADRVNKVVPIADRLGLPVEGWAILQPAYMGLVGLAVLASVWWVNRRQPNPVALRYSTEALMLFRLFVTFAGLAHLLTVAAFDRATLSVTVEEAGEMLVGTAIVAHAIAHVLRVRHDASATSVHRSAEPHPGRTAQPATRQGIATHKALSPSSSGHRVRVRRPLGTPVARAHRRRTGSVDEADPHIDHETGSEAPMRQGDAGHSHHRPSVPGPLRRLR